MGAGQGPCHSTHRPRCWVEKMLPGSKTGDSIRFWKKISIVKNETGVSRPVADVIANVDADLVKPLSKLSASKAERTPLEKSRNGVFQA